MRKSEYRGYEWEDLIVRELVRLQEPNKDKKEATVIELVSAKLEGRSQASVFKMNGTCSHNAYYRRDLTKEGMMRGWKFNPTFLDVYGRSLTIARAWKQRRRLEKMKERRDEWDEEIYTLNVEVLAKIKQMLQFPLQRVITETDEDGTPIQTIIQPVRWTMDTVGRLMLSSNKLMRLLFSMPTDILDGDIGAAPGDRRPTADDEIQGMSERELEAMIKNLSIINENDMTAAEYDEAIDADPDLP